jgi:hypothetical protein
MQPAAMERGYICGVLYRADAGELHLPSGLTEVPDHGSEVDSDEEEQPVSRSGLPGVILTGGLRVPATFFSVQSLNC